MSKVSEILRRGQGRYFHWCPACERIHPLPDGWTFNGDINGPTFSPSFRQEYFQRVGDQTERPRGEMRVCHYFIVQGTIQFCADSWHGRSDIVVLPALPAGASIDG